MTPAGRAAAIALIGDPLLLDLFGATSWPHLIRLLGGHPVGWQDGLTSGSAPSRAGISVHRTSPTPSFRRASRSTTCGVHDRHDTTWRPAEPRARAVCSRPGARRQRPLCSSFWPAQSRRSSSAARSPAMLLNGTVRAQRDVVNASHLVKRLPGVLLAQHNLQRRHPRPDRGSWSRARARSASTSAGAPAFDKQQWARLCEGVGEHVSLSPVPKRGIDQHATALTEPPRLRGTPAARTCPGWTRRCSAPGSAACVGRRPTSCLRITSELNKRQPRALGDLPREKRLAAGRHPTEHDRQGQPSAPTESLCEVEQFVGLRNLSADWGMLPGGCWPARTRSTFARTSARWVAKKASRASSPAAPPAAR